MKIHRVVPPAAALLDFISLINGLAGIISARRYLERFETESRDYFNVNNIFSVSSGKAALMLALSALKRLSPDKNEVIIPAYTCYSVPAAILKADLKIVLCDIDASTFDFDYNSLRETAKHKYTLHHSNSPFRNSCRRGQNLFAPREERFFHSQGCRSSHGGIIQR